MYAAFTGFVENGMLFISRMIDRTLKGRHLKRTPLAAST
jgi:hypothetical protein